MVIYCLTRTIFDINRYYPEWFKTPTDKISILLFFLTFIMPFTGALISGTNGLKNWNFFVLIHIGLSLIQLLSFFPLIT
jgi:cytochrome b561